MCIYAYLFQYLFDNDNRQGVVGCDRIEMLFVYLYLYLYFPLYLYAYLFEYLFDYNDVTASCG